MAPPRADGFYRYDLVKLYIEGASLVELRNLTGAGILTIKKHLIRSGVFIRGIKGASRIRWERDVWKPITDVVARYLSGESSNDIAATENIGRATIIKFLKREGVTIRDTGDNLKVWYSRQPPDKIIERCNHGKYAISVIKGAITSQRTLNRVGRGEIELFQFLDGYNMPLIQQLAVGPYNIDIAVGDHVAVEVERSNTHPFRLRRYAERVKYFIDRDWFVISVWAPSRRPEITIECAIDIVSYFEFFKAGGSIDPKYRVIWGSGEDVSLSSYNGYKWPLIPPAI